MVVRSWMVVVVCLLSIGLIRVGLLWVAMGVLTGWWFFLRWNLARFMRSLCFPIQMSLSFHSNLTASFTSMNLMNPNLLFLLFFFFAMYTSTTRPYAWKIFHKSFSSNRCGKFWKKKDVAHLLMSSMSSFLLRRRTSCHSPLSLSLISRRLNFTCNLVMFQWSVLLIRFSP